MEKIEPICQINDNLFFGKRNGKYIHVGAGSKSFATEYLENELGWSGILIEPNPVSRKRLETLRPNNQIICWPISIYPTVYFHSYYGDSADMSAIETTVNDDIATVYYNNEIIINEKKTIDIFETKQLTDIIHQSYDLLIIETNGHELEVLESWDFSYPIEYILYYSKTMDESRLEECETILKYQKYSLVDSVLIDYQMFDVWKKDSPISCVLM